MQRRNPPPKGSSQLIGKWGESREGVLVAAVVYVAVGAR